MQVQNAILLVTLLGLSAAEEPVEPAPSPIPLRRILLNPERLPQELDRVKQGMLVPLPRAEFEDRLRQASEAVAAQKNVPRLVESRYQAVLADSALVGVGEWQVAHPTNQPGLMPLPSFNLSLRRQASSPHDEALALGEFGKGPALLLTGERRGSGGRMHQVDLEWSLRGDARPDGLHFELKLPASPIATLELVLPPRWQITLPEGGLVTGPRELRREGSPPREVLPASLQRLLQSEKPLARWVPAGSQLWTVHLSGLSRLRLVLRPPGSQGGPIPVVVHRHLTTLTLSPEVLEARFELDLESPTRGFSDLTCECDPQLRPYAVSLANLDSWKVNPGPTPDSPLLLSLKLKEPIHEGSLRISCLAPMDGRTAFPGRPDGLGRPSYEQKSWTSPWLRLVGAVPRGETVVLRLHPEVRLSSWDAGDFRLSDTAGEMDQDRVAWQRLTLIGGGLVTEGKYPKRPTARLQVHPVEFRARQLAWWQPGPRRSVLTLQIHCEPGVGQLFDLPVQLPAGWDVERVEMSPPGWLGSCHERQEGGKRILLVQLQKPLTSRGRGRSGGPARTGILTVGLSGPGVRLHQPLPFPEAIPLGARFREGALAVSVDPAFQPAQVRTRLAAVPAADALGSAEGPWGSQVPGLYFPYREQVPEGTLVLQPSRLQLRAATITEVLVSAGPPALETQLEIEVEAGTTESLEVHAPGGWSGPWSWRSLTPGISLQRAERLTERETAAAAGWVALLAPQGLAGSPLLTASRLTVDPPDPRWRLLFNRSLRPQDHLILQAATTLIEVGRDGPGPQMTLYSVPLLQVPQARRLEGEVRLRLQTLPARPVDVGTRGLQEIPVPEAPLLHGRAAWRAFRTGPDRGWLTLRSLTLPARPEDNRALANSAPPVISRAHLINCLGPDGMLKQHFQFSLTGWTEAVLPVQLPPGARFLAAGVDGRWLEQLPTGEGTEDQLIHLPVPKPASSLGGGAPTQQIEMIYLTQVPPWRLQCRLNGAAPVLPLEPVSLQRSWRLPTDVQPAGGHGPPARSPSPNAVSWSGVLARWLGLAWRLEPARPVADPGASDFGAGLTEPASSLLAPDPSAPAGELSGGSTLVVVRTRALLGLAWLLSASLVLMLAGWPWKSSRRRLTFLLLWLALTGLAWLWLSPPLEIVAAWPLLTGLIAALAWYGAFLVRRSIAGDRRAAPLTKIRPAGALGDGSHHGTSSGDGNGTALPSSWGTAGLLLALGGCCCGLGLVGQCLGDSNSAGPPGPDTPRPAVSSQPPFSVYLLPQTGDRPGEPTVLVPPELLEQLGELTRSATLANGSAVLLQADYEGRLIEGSSTPVAQFEATFQVLALAEESIAALPLEGLTLKGPFQVDGLDAPILPLPGGRPEEGCAFKLSGKGRHKIQLRFQVRAATGGDPAGDRSIQLNLPRVAASRLRFQGPAGAVALHALGGQGWQQVLAPEGRGEKNQSGPTLEVDLGRLPGPVHLGWYQESGKDNRPGRVRYQEAYLWDLNGEASTLHGLIHYQIDRGTVPSLILDLPGGLELHSAVASRVRVPAGPAARTPLELVNDGSVRVRGWRPQGAAVLVDFQVPVTGDLILAVELIPRNPLRALSILPVPAPRGTLLPGAEVSYLAYHARDLEAKIESTLRVTGIPPAQFAPFWPAASRPAGPALQYCCTFHREPTKPPALELRLAWPTPDVQAMQEVQLRVGPTHAELRATAELTARGPGTAMPSKCLTLVEWEIQGPGWVVVSVEGREVRRWSQAGNRLLIWLDRTTASTRLELTGWLSLTGPSGKGRLELPWLRLHPARTQMTTVRLIPEPGVDLVAGPLPGLHPVGSALPRDRSGAPAASLERVYQAQDFAYRGTFQLRPVPETGLSRGAVRLLTLVEEVDQQLVFTSSLVYRLPAGEKRTIQVRLRDWFGDKVELRGAQLPAGSVREFAGRHRPATPLSRGERLWGVDLPAGTDQPQTLILRGQIPLRDVRQGTWWPDVTVQGLTWQQGWLALAGKELTASGAQGVIEQPNLARLVADQRPPTAGGGVPVWAKEAERLRRAGGKLWRITAEAWSLRVTPVAVPEAEPLQVLLAEQQSAVVDGQRWLHEATWWVQQSGPLPETQGGVLVRLPQPRRGGPAKVLAAAVDGVEIQPEMVQPGKLWLPLVGAGSVRRLQLRWQLAPGSERLERPQLDMPVLEGTRSGPTLWTVLVPPGFILHDRSGAGFQTGPARLARLFLERAAVAGQVAEALAGLTTEGDRQARKAALGRLAHFCRLAEQQLDLAAGTAEKGPAGQTLSEWLAALWSHLPREGRESKRETPETALPAFDPEPFLAGTPCAAVNPKGGTPEVVLGSERVRQSQRALAGSAEWLGILGLVWLLTLVPYLPALARLLWPEQLLLLAVICWVAGITGVVVAPLVLLALLGRLASWLQRWRLR